MWDRLIDWLDNPILVRHVRSRLRIQPVASSMVVALVLCLCILWGGYELHSLDNGRAYDWLVVLQAVLLIATGIFVVASFGLALQFFLLQFGARGTMYFALYLFITWLVPVVVGTVLAMTVNGPMEDWRYQSVFASSPVLGIGMSALSGSIPGGATGAVQGAALTPALFFAFLFNSLLEGARRRVHRAFAAAAASTAGPAGAHARLVAAEQS
jgi:hypothetical protein